MLKTSSACLAFCLSTAILMSGCSPARFYQQTDEKISGIIAEKQQEALGRSESLSLHSPADLLRQKLLIEQQLPRVGPESLGSAHLPPSDHWPQQAKPPVSDPTSRLEPVSTTEPLSLIDALQVAARNSREYQTRKEDLFRSALALDFERDAFRSTLSGSLEGRYVQDRSASSTTGNPVEGTATSLLGGVSRLLKSGATLTAQIGLDLIQMLQPGKASSSGLFGDTSITVPLLRGAGRHIATESLTQAERDTLYAVWTFERFKQEFAVSVTDSYYSVLQTNDTLRNQAENYRGLIASSRRAMRLAEAGKLPQIQVDQSLQNELRARERWIAARQSQARALDNFKNLIGLPTDAQITLDRDEFSHLENTISRELPRVFEDSATQPSTVAGAEAEIVLRPPSRAESGRFEIDPAEAGSIALKNRVDIKIARYRVADAQRHIVVAADALLPELTLFGSVATGTGRSIAALQSDNSTRLDFNRGYYQGILTLDLPWERTAEAIAYRDSYISLERAVRSLQELEDQVKLQVRNDLRELEQARAGLKIQQQAVTLAERRVRGAELQLQAGRAQMRDLLEAQEALLSAQNALTAVMVDYRSAELATQRDLGTLQVDANGIWHEYPSGDTQL
ncbi:MAG: TolC family protein [Desulfuromonadales bacterium]|nr:TolC family protein [Desulfuromonadales bacterium]